MKKQMNRQKNSNDINRQFYDEAFTEIFSSLPIIRSLLEDFIHEDWVKIIDFDSMRVTKSVFKGITRGRRESDLLLQFDLAGSPETLNIFILMEFQRKPEDMILRLLEYLLRCYREQKKKGKVLSPVIPIVIYNGKTLWKEAPDMSKHFHTITKDLKPYLPVFRYILFDIVRMNDKWLRKFKDAAAWFFMLEKTNLKEMAQAEQRIKDLLQELQITDNSTFLLLKKYLKGLLNYKGVDSKVLNDYIEHIEERGTGMLAESFDELMEDKRLEGLEQGLKQVKEEKKEMVLKMLEAGLEIKMISHISGMTAKEIKTLN